MKITKSQLKRIIKEEIESVIHEMHDCEEEHPGEDHQTWWAKTKMEELELDEQ